MVYFCGLTPAANRLSKSDYLISEYISEIGKARYLHGDKSVVDLSMGNPDLIPPEKAKEALKEKVNDLWSHRYNNPTGSFAPKKVFEEAVKWAKEHKTLIIHDMDNSEVTHSGRKPTGIMQVDGAKDVAFQIHTMSKAQSMPGLRVAFTVSDKENIDNLLNNKQF